MDVHRCRFVPYPTAAINALAFSHSTDLELGNAQTELRLAVGRANGDIELWNPVDGLWTQETIFRAGRQRSVEGLQWTQEPDTIDPDGSVQRGALRLFSIGYTSTVTEWDLTTGLPLRHSTGNHSEAWCLAAQPRYHSSAAQQNGVSKLDDQSYNQEIVIGCADGTLALLSTENDDLQFKRFLARSLTRKARCLSVTYQSRHVVVAGFADSNVRIYDSRTGATIRNVSLGAAPRGGPRDILIWQVRCLSNGDIVTGDSTGEVRFLDGKNYSIYQAIKAHEADVLDIAVSQDASYVWTSGMDRRTVTYFRSGAKGKWAKGQQKVYHEHDVKALATFEGKKMSMIVSGGLDTNMVVMPLREFREENSRKLSGLPHSSPVVSIPHRRMMASWWDRDISIWQVLRKGQQSDSDKPYKLRARIALKDDESIATASIARVSDEEDLLAIGSAAGIKLFKISHVGGANKPLSLTKVDHNISIENVRLLSMSEDARWLAVVSDENNIRMIRIDQTGDGDMHFAPLRKSLRRSRRPEHNISGLEKYLDTITRISFAPNSQAIVVSDLSGRIDGWSLSQDGSPDQNGHTEDSSSESEDEDGSFTTAVGEPITSYHWIQLTGTKMMPKLGNAPLILTFRPNANPSQYHLVVLTSSHQLYEFDLSTGSMTTWSQRNPSTALPRQFRILRDRAVGSFWHVTPEHERMWIYGASWIAMFDMTNTLKRKKNAIIQEQRQRAYAGFGADSLYGDKNTDVGILDDGSRTVAGSRTRVEDMQGLIPIQRTEEDRAARKKRRKMEKEARRKQEETDPEDDETRVNGVKTNERTITESESENEVDRETRKPGRKFFLELKYRPILGIAPMDRTLEDPDSGPDSEDVIEAVIVERPVFDLDLPPRFEIGQRPF